jgi:CHAT domain-containing protein/tetratricopeptide (TPR) repeat protein
VASPTWPVLALRGSRLAHAALVLLCFVPLLTAAPADSPPRSTSANPAQEKTPAIRLEGGKPFEKSLAGGDADSYEIQVRAGQFFHAVVDQLGIDVVLTIYGPDGKRIATMDSPNGAFGLEQISTIAGSAGVYRLEVVPGDKDASAGRYRVTISPPRAPTATDRARIEAEQRLAATAQMPLGNAESRRRVAQRYEETLELWRAAGDTYEEALTLNNIGQIELRLGDARKALDYWNQALPLYRLARDRAGEAAVLSNIALANDSLGQKQKALEYNNLALPLARAAGDCMGEAAILSNIGSLYGDLGEKQQALDYFRQALPLRRAAGDRDGEAATLNNIGETYVDLGDAPEALHSFEQALPLARAAHDGFGEAVSLTNIGFAHKALGEMQEALSFYKQALLLHRAIGDRDEEAATLSDIGKLYAELGDNEKALNYYNQGLPLQQAAGDRLGEARTLNSIGRTYYDMGKKQEALDSYSQALPLHRAVGDRAGEAATLQNIGDVYTSLGEEQRALDYYNQALPLRRAVGDRNGEAATLNTISVVHALHGEKEQALAGYSAALALAREVRSPLEEADILNNLMALWRSAGEPGTAIFFGKQAVDKYQQVRANIRGFEKQTQQSFLKSKEKTYRVLAELLIGQGRLPEAQQVLGLLKNEEYFEFIRRDGKEAGSRAAPVNLTKNEEVLELEYEANAGRVTAVGNEWAALRAKPERTPEEERRFAELSEQLKAANGAWEKFLSGLYAELRQVKSAEESQKEVAQRQEEASGMQRVVRQLSTTSGAVALYTLVGEERYRVIVVTPTVMVAREYPIKAEDLRKKVFEFRQALIDPKSDPVPQAQELYRILIGSAAQDLAGAKAETLMWSLDDVLRYVPMAALHDGHEYLVEKYRNEVFTPASVASLTERPNVNGWRGLGMGVSKSYGDFSALPSVPEELHGIIHDKNIPGSSGVLPGQMMLDETFTEDGMKKALELNYPLIHIASHFALVPGNETNSFLLLGGKDPQGEHLSLAEIRKDPGYSFTDTELLTLSACNTAVSGAAGDGREVDGLGILAQQKGARAVVASLWGVYDPSTGILMQEFYKLWTTHLDMTKGEALREAQLELLRGTFATDASSRPIYTHPFYWAPFILIGNWR